MTQEVSPEPRAEPEREGPHRGMVARNIGALLISQAITWGLAMVLTVVQPRYLGPSGIGQLRLGMSVWAIVNVFAELGTSTLLTLSYARDPRSANALLAPIVRLRAFAEMVGWIAVLIFVIVAGYDFDTGVVVAIVGVGMSVTIIGEMARAALYGLQVMSATARVDVYVKVFTVVSVITVLLAGGRARSVAWTMLGAAILSGALMWRALRQHRDPRPILRAVDHRTVVKRGSPYLLGSAVQIVYGSLDIIVISLVATTDEIGWYAAAAILFGSLLFIPTTVMTSLFPALAQIHEQRPEALDDLLRRAFRSMVVLAVPIGIGAIVVANPTARLLFGEDFTEAGPVLAVFGVVLIITFQTILFGIFAFATGRHRMFNTVMIVVTIATIPLDLVLVPWSHRQFDNGAIGGAMAYVVTEGMILTYALWKLAPQLLDRTTFVRVGKAFVAGATMGAAAWPLRETFLAVPIVVGAITYIGVALLLRLPDDYERELFSKLLARLRSALGRGEPDLSSANEAD